MTAVSPKRKWSPRHSRLQHLTQRAGADFRCGCEIKSHFEAKQTSSLVTFAGFLRVLRYIGADYTLRLSAQIENEVIEWAILKSKMRVFELRI